MINQLFENHIVEQSVKLVVDIFTVFILVATIMLQVVSMVIAANTLVSSFYGLLCQQISSALSTLLFFIPIERERKAIVLSGKERLHIEWVSQIINQYMPYLQLTLSLYPQLTCFDLTWLDRHTIHGEYNLDVSTVPYPYNDVANSSMEYNAIDRLDTDGTILHKWEAWDEKRWCQRWILSYHTTH